MSKTRKATKLPTGARNTVAYREGRKAYEKGSDLCPYEQWSGDQRSSWWTGWYDARINDRLGHIWEKWGISYP